MSFPTTVGGRYGFEKITTSEQRQVLGAEMAFPDGRKYRYVENGGTAIEEGMIVASEAPAGNHDEDLAVTTAAAGSSSITVTLGATAAAKNLYAEGYLFFNLPTLSTAGSRVFYKIIVIFNISYHRNITEIFCCSPNHCRSPNINIFNYIFMTIFIF